MRLVDELEQVKNELAWYRDYAYYVSRVHTIVDAEACGYADGDEEYEENFKD